VGSDTPEFTGGTRDVFPKKCEKREKRTPKQKRPMDIGEHPRKKGAHDRARASWKNACTVSKRGAMNTHC